jgi:thiol peroxidase
MERTKAVTIKGNPMTLVGQEVKTGQSAPEFNAVNSDLKDVSLSTFKGKVKLIASVPSLDTPICDLEIKRFNDEAAKLSKDLIILFVSTDLPFAQKRFCSDNKIKKVKTLSDHKDADFGEKFGVLIKELRLLSRAIFVLDRDDKVTYVEYVPELSSHPSYEAALDALKKVVG